MKLNDLFETSAAGMTSVASIGQVEFQAFPNRIHLYKRDCNDQSKCIAKIKRKNNDGWRLVTTKDWNGMKLPHIGYLNGIKADKNGMKTISNDLGKMLKAWGINFDEVKNKASV